VSGQTLYDKLWMDHLVEERDDGTSLIYIDRHLLHEVTSPQAFEGLRLAGRNLWRRDSNLAVPDHNVPTDLTERQGGIEGIVDATSQLQVQTLEDNCVDFNVKQIPINDERQGIVHVVGPEQGATLPGMTIVCGDSHTSTHGALGSLAHGIGTSEVEHVLATQCLVQTKMKNMRIDIFGSLQAGVTAKDVALAVIGQIGTAGGSGYAIEFAGQVVRSLSMEGRMTLCNMSIEAGARMGMIAVDSTTIDYVRGRPYAPKGELWERAVKSWKKLCSDNDAIFEREIRIDGASIEPQVTWGTSPEMVLPIVGRLPSPEDATDSTKKEAIRRALEYMDLAPGTPVSDIPVDRVFIGSCTNSRIEDLRQAAQIIKGRNIAASVKQALVVPGSGIVKTQAEAEGLDKIFLAAGMEWRAPGCSMCLGMNSDTLGDGEHCASTSNRNFEGRQGFGGRTHLVSPAMAAAAAVTGYFTDVREFLGSDSI